MYYSTFHVDKTHVTPRLICILNFKDSATGMDGATNYDIQRQSSNEIFMGDSWFQSVPNEQSIRGYGGRIKVIYKAAHNISPILVLKLLWRLSQEENISNGVSGL